jgi:hypothetical protein
MDLAKRLEISPITMSRYRMGDRVPSRDMLAKISSELGWSLNKQYAAIEAGTYAADFRTFLYEKFGIPIERGASTS